jgi:glutamyl-Q tRNA(Asp) synthetase
MPPYIGRFAPSPTGPLHAGSLVAALASWLDARAHGGRWLVRIEDVDHTRCLAGLDQIILQQLSLCGLHSDLPPLYQSRRTGAYQQALETLIQRGLAYPCACSRKSIAAALLRTHAGKPRHGELVYPGTCRAGLAGQPARAWRFRTDLGLSHCPPVRQTADSASPAELHFPALQDTALASLDGPTDWFDRRLGEQQQVVTDQVGDFVLRRADGCHAYQLAVVTDDAAQGVSHVVRGEDLADNTARQILLQRALGLATPAYLHTPLVLGADGQKLSKQNAAQALDLEQPLAALNQAARTLGLDGANGNLHAALLGWTRQWAARWCQIKTGGFQS